MKNTKLFILGALACCLGLVANAQISYGPVIGLNLAELTEVDDGLVTMKPGFHAGLLVDWGVSENLAFETGLVYSQKGTKFEDVDALKFNLNYLEIPFMPKYKAKSGFNFYMGPYLGILMSSKLTDGTDELDLKEETNSLEAGMKLGLGYQLASGLAFSAHYDLGLTDISKDVEDNGIKNAVIGISVAYMMGGK